RCPTGSASRCNQALRDAQPIMPPMTRNLVRMVRAPETIATPRLILRRPRAGDAEAIFVRYSADPDVTRYVGWPAHKSVGDTRAFLAFDDGQWQQWPAGSYLAWSRADGTLV